MTADAPPGLISGLPPVTGPDLEILILGSFPSVASLRETAYYANPRNHFWQIIEAIFGISAGLPYPARCRGLVAEGVALWDVAGRCRRKGSSDASITAVIPNPIPEFIAENPTIRLIALNGSTAARIFRVHVLTPYPGLTEMAIALPSTSPAHARVSLPAKLAAWEAIRSRQDRSSPVTQYPHHPT